MIYFQLWYYNNNNGNIKVTLNKGICNILHMYI